MAKLTNWLRGPWSPEVLVVLVALFVAATANTTFFSGIIKAYPPGDGNLGFLVSLIAFLTGIFTLLLAAASHGRATKPLLIAFLLLAAMIAHFMDEYGTIVDRHMLDNVVETNMAEASDLLTWPLVWNVGLFGVLPALLVWKAPLVRRQWKKALLSRVKLAVGAAAVIAGIYLAFSPSYFSMYRMQRPLLAQIIPTHTLGSAVKMVRLALKSGSLPPLIVGADAKVPEADVDRELIIMVVGETARADHFSLNGYERETNPLLKKESVFNFPNFWSCATSTAESVPCMFSHYRREQFDKRHAKVADNALDILKRAGGSILWRDNNSSSKHVADRVKYEHFLDPEKNTICDTECRDEGMLVGLQDYIDARPEGDILIVLHSMGNHGPAYYKRYPPEFEKFTPVCKTSDLGSCTTEEVHNAYDNAILYTDYFLSKVIALLKENDDRFETAMIYASDHGESLGEKGLYLHGLPYFVAPEEQRHIPFLMWFGRNFDQEYLGKIEQRRKERLSHDNIFATLLGLFELRTTAYDPKMDLLDHSKVEMVEAAERTRVGQADPAEIGQTQ